MKEKISYNVFSIFFINVAFWISSDYPRHIFRSASMGLDIPKSIVNLLSMTVYFIFLVLFVSNGKSLFSEQIFDNDRKQQISQSLKKICLLVAIQLCFEFLNATVVSLFGLWGFLAQDLILILLWIAFFAVLSYKQNLKLKFTRNLIVFFAIVLLAVVACLIVDTSICLKLFELYEQYIPFSNPLQVLSQNYLFIHSIVLLIFDTVLGIAVIVLLSQREIKSPTLMDLIKEEEAKTQKNDSVAVKIGTYLVRLVLLGFVGYVLVIPSALFARTDLWSNLSVHTSNKGGISDGGFGNSVTTISMSRFDDLGGQRTCFSYKVVSVNNTFFDGKRIGDSFVLNDDRDNYEIIDNHLERANNYKEYIVDGQSVYIYKNSAICYVKDGVPVVVPFDNLSDISKDEVVSSVLRVILEEGDILAFEYGGEYMLKHDLSFIHPYIERYRNGEFSSKEKNFIDVFKYNEDYIINCANELSL